MADETLSDLVLRELQARGVRVTAVDEQSMHGGSVRVTATVHLRDRTERFWCQAMLKGPRFDIDEVADEVADGIYERIEESMRPSFTPASLRALAEKRLGPRSAAFVACPDSGRVEVMVGRYGGESVPMASMAAIQEAIDQFRPVAVRVAVLCPRQEALDPATPPERLAWVAEVYPELVLQNESLPALALLDLPAWKRVVDAARGAMAKRQAESAGR